VQEFLEEMRRTPRILPMLIGADGASAQASRPQPRIIVPVTAGSGKLRPFSFFVLLFLSFIFCFFIFQLRPATRAAHKRRLSTLSERIMSNASRFKGKKMFFE
jgi:hypothetical protein